jgi:hypothetical protein
VSNSDTNCCENNKPVFKGKTLSAIIIGKALSLTHFNKTRLKDPIDFDCYQQMGLYAVTSENNCHDKARKFSQ